MDSRMKWTQLIQASRKMYHHSSSQYTSMILLTYEFRFSTGAFLIASRIFMFWCEPDTWFISMQSVLKETVVLSSICAIVFTQSLTMCLSIRRFLQYLKFLRIFPFIGIVRFWSYNPFKIKLFSNKSEIAGLICPRA